MNTTNMNLTKQEREFKRLDLDTTRGTNFEKGEANVETSCTNDALLICIDLKRKNKVPYLKYKILSTD